MAGTGVASFIQIKQESAWGTPSTQDFWLLPMIEEGISLEIEEIEAEYIQGGAARPDPAEGGRAVRGTLTMPLTYGRIDHFLEGVFGTFTQSQPTSAVLTFDHWAELATTLPSYTIEINRGDIESDNEVFIYEGMKVDQVAISVPSQGPGRIVVTFLGQTESSVIPTGSAYSATGQVALAVQEVLASHLQAGYDLGPNPDSGAYCINSMEVNISRGLETRFCLGDAQTKEPLAENFAEVTGTFVVDFDDRNIYDSFRAFTFETSGTLTFQHPTAIETVAGPNTYYPSLVFELNRIKYSSPSHPFVNTRGTLRATCPWVGSGNAGTAANGTPGEVSSKEPIAIKTRNINDATDL